VALPNVVFKRRQATPARMDLEFLRILDRLERMVVKTSRFGAGWNLDVVDRFLHFALSARTSLKSGEEVDLHLACSAMI